MNPCDLINKLWWWWWWERWVLTAMCTRRLQSACLSTLNDNDLFARSIAWFLNATGVSASRVGSSAPPQEFRSATFGRYSKRDALAACVRCRRREITTERTDHGRWRTTFLYTPVWIHSSAFHSSVAGTVTKLSHRYTNNENRFRTHGQPHTNRNWLKS